MPKKKLPSNFVLPYIAILITTLIWGAAGPVIKYTLRFLPPLTFLFLRFLIVCIVLLPYVYFELKRTKISKKDYLNFFLLGLFSQSALAIYFVGLNYTKVLDAAIIGVMGSIMTVAAGNYFYKDKIDSKVKLGLVLASLGTILIILEPAFSGNGKIIIEHRILGNLIILFYHFFWTTFVVWSKMSMGENSPSLKKALSFIHLKPMTKKYSPILITSISFYIGLLTLIPLALLENMYSLTQFDILFIDHRGLLGLLYMALLSSIVAYMCYEWALEHIRVTDISFFGYLGSIFTIPFAYILLGEVPNKFMVMGAIIIGIGVYIAERKET